MDLSQFDFLDFGGSKGASLRFGVKYFQGKRGLAIDNSAQKVTNMNEQGLDCLQADVTRLDLPPGAVRFVIMSHFLEHLPDLKSVRETIISAARVATDFIFIQGPFFDEDDYLEELGLKLFYSDWTAHTCPLTTRQLSGILESQGLHNYEMRFTTPQLTDSTDSQFHPLSSKQNQHRYDPAIHPAKQEVIFSRPIYPEFTCTVLLKNLSYEVYRRPTTVLANQ